MGSDTEVIRVIATELETQVRMADDGRVLAHTTEQIAVHIVAALYTEGYEIKSRSSR